LNYLFKTFKRLSIKMKNGFTMLELLGAILVILIGVLTAYGVVQNIITYTIDSSDRIIAAYLAKEGVEIVRNIRDTNWVENNPNWDDGLAAGDWEVDYNTTGIISDTYDGDFLKVDGNGFYNYSTGELTKFQRRIGITPFGDDEIKIVVEVLWSKRGQSRNITVQENIYDWK